MERAAIFEAKAKTGVSPKRHVFIYAVTTTDGRKAPMKIPVKVRHAKSIVFLTLKREHVERAIALRGIGDTANCTMAICAKEHAAAFPHPVEGHMDWSYSRCWVVSRVRDGLPTECVAYEHHDKVARLNDSYEGQQKLLEILTEEGPRTITLLPVRFRPKSERLKDDEERPRNKARDPARHILKGAQLRQAYVQAGVVAAMEASDANP